MKSNGSVIKHGILVLGVCASLAAGTLGFGGSAEARIRDPDASLMWDICYRIQTAYDTAEGYRNKAGANLTERNYWQGQMDDAQAEWKSRGCDLFYGSIVVMVKVQPAVEYTEQLSPAEGVAAPLTPSRVRIAAGSVITN